jgi:hypothetical protein
MMRMDPNELPRLKQIEADTHRLLAEARTKGWDGEVSALENHPAAYRREGAAGRTFTHGRATGADRTDQAVGTLTHPFGVALANRGRYTERLAKLTCQPSDQH